MENANVALPILERLKQALRMDTDTQLAEALGLSVQALNKRKMRGSLPTDEIDTLVNERGLAAAWVYSGIGPMYEGGEAEARRMAEMQELSEQLAAMQLRISTRTAVEQLLRSVARGDARSLEAVVEQMSGMSDDERDVLLRYRTADPDLRRAIDRLLPLVSRHTLHETAREVVYGQQFNGPVGNAAGRDMVISDASRHAGRSAAAKQRTPRS